MIQLYPSETVSEVVQKLKGGTSYLLRKEFPEISEFIWGDRFWAEGYYAETIGTQNVSALKKYIRENEGSIPQRKGTTRGPGL